MLFGCWEQDGRDERWPAETRDFSQAVDDVKGGRPSLVDRICRGPLLDVLRATLENEAAIVGREAFAVEDKSVQELSTCKGHKHPAPYPVWLALLSPDTLLLCGIVCELERATEGVDGDADTQLRGRTRSEEESR